MMKEITVSAKTLNDAITEASIQLGVASDEMEYDVIEKGSAGFLGIGSKQAVIRARRKKEEEEESVIEAIKLSDEVSSFDKKEKKEIKKEIKKNHKENHKESSVRETKKETKESNNKELKKEKKKEEKKEESRPEKKELDIAAVTEGTQKICEKFLLDVLNAMGMSGVEITSKIDSDGVLDIEMSGDNMGILIGKRGQTLDSLQYLTNRVANKSQEGYVRVKLDTEDYRRRRKQTLENLAKNIAYKVKRSRKPVSLEPMNPYERRIIHSALQGDDRVSTHSEGEEPYRRVVVTPNRR